MSFEIIKEKMAEGNKDSNELFDFVVNSKLNIKIYTKSIIELNNTVFFIARKDSEKYLFLISDGLNNNYFQKFEGIFIDIEDDKSELKVKKCFLNTNNRKVIQQLFDFANPKPIGLDNSFGFGDRLGLANPGHIRSLSISNFKPILAQQSIRELSRTNRKPEDVLDAAVWAVFQEGYKHGFGADADHLKTPADIDLMFDAGFTTFTFDPGEHVDNEADNYNDDTLYKIVASLPWNELNDSFNSAEKRYVNKPITISDSLSLTINSEQLLRAYAKYGRAIVHIKKMYEYLKVKCINCKYELEVSVDETESVTSIFEHYFFANELHRLNIKFISLAPRFVGSFEKGIDYKGDLDYFKSEYEKHLAIVKYFGDYKLSLHSGSDKFSIYRVIGSYKASTHVKTAGTSYLEALKVVASKNPGLFKRILNYSIDLYDVEKKTYHVSADLNLVKPGEEYRDEELITLFDSNDIRQILHVTFGRILTDKDNSGRYLFKDEIYKCLTDNEELHYNFLIKHFHKHLEPFN